MRTNFFDFVRQSRYWKVATSIETFKFTLYLGIPVAASVFYADADFMHGLVKRLNYIRYPKEGQKPSIEMIEKERELSKKLRAVQEKYKKN
jgi:hypothetical protein